MTHYQRISLCTLFISSTVIAHPTIDNAPSSVQLYGQIDQGFHIASPSTSNRQHEAIEVKDNQLSSSRFGLKGKEDLGNNHFITFQVEGNVFPRKKNADVFDRRKTLGYQHPYLGKVDVGLQTSVGFDVARAFDPSGLISKDHTTFDLSGYTANHRANKYGTQMIKYQKYFDHSKVALAYQPTNQVGDGPEQGSFAVAGLHSVGPTRFGASYSKVSLPHGDAHIVNGGLAHQMGAVKLFMGGSHSHTPAHATQLESTIQNIGVGFKYAHTRKLEFIAASYGEWIKDDVSSSHGSKLVLGSHYALSNRTKLYSFLSHRRGHRSNHHPDDQMATSLSMGMLHKF